LKKSPHDLAVHQEKIFEIDTHMGICISGMTADARFLTKFMRNACLNYSYVYGSKQPCERLISIIGKKSQTKTCHPSKRPFGVGLLVGSIDQAGTHLFETCPSGNYYEYTSMAIGDKCQSAKTYLEKHYDTFAGLDADALIAHGVKSMKASAAETELTEHNLSIGVLGKGQDFRQFTKDEIRAVIAAAGGEEAMQIN
jgi:20S proteasome subunit alpha 6